MSQFDLNHLPQDHEKASFAWKPEAWVKDAACREYPTWLFYDESDEGDAEAKLICRSCPVRRQCLEKAMIEEKAQPSVGGNSPTRFGIRGGTTPAERATLRPTTKP